MLKFLERKKDIKPEPIKEKPLSEMSSEEALQATVERLTRVMEKMRIAEYVQYLEHPWRLLWSNFLIGVARGLGSTIGLANYFWQFCFFILQHIVSSICPLSAI